MGWDWVDEPRRPEAFGERVRRPKKSGGSGPCATRMAAAAAVVVSVLALSACPSPGPREGRPCSPDGEQRITPPGEVFLCEDGRWRLYRAPGSRG